MFSLLLTFVSITLNNTIIWSLLDLLALESIISFFFKDEKFSLFVLPHSLQVFVSHIFIIYPHIYNIK
jgi:hypothetical protein